MGLHLKIIVGLLLLIQALHLASLQYTTDSPGRTIDRKWLRDLAKDTAGSPNAVVAEELTDDRGLDAMEISNEYSSGIASGSMVVYNTDEEENLSPQDESANEKPDDLTASDTNLPDTFPMDVTTKQPLLPGNTVSPTNGASYPTSSKQTTVAKVEEEFHDSTTTATTTPQDSKTVLSEENPKTDLSEEIPKTDLSEENPKTDLSEHNSTTNLSEENPKNDLTEENPKTDLIEENPKTDLSEQNSTTPLSEENPKTDLTEQNSKTDLSEQNSTTPLSEENPKTDQSEENPKTDLSKQNSTTPLSEEIPQTDLSGQNSNLSNSSKPTDLQTTTLAPDGQATQGSTAKPDNYTVSPDVKESTTTKTVTTTTKPEIKESSTTSSPTTTLPPEVPAPTTTPAPITPEKANKTDIDAASGSSSERGLATDQQKSKRHGVWGAVLGTAVAVAFVGLVAYIILKKKHRKGFSHSKLVEEFNSDPVLRLDNNDPLDLNFGLGGSAYYNPALQGDNIQMSNFPGRR